jgi:hypothetical protein
MVDVTLIQSLETALNHGTLNDRDVRRVRKLLPDLRTGSLDPDDRLDLVEIATEFAHNQPAATVTSVTLGDANTIADANAAIGNRTGRDFNQKNQSGGVDASGTHIELMRDMVGESIQLLWPTD